MSRIVLDNASRGVTSLLSSCSPPTTSSQLTDGTTVNDGTGDTLFNAGRKLKQWAADINAMTAELYAGAAVGAIIANTLAAGTTNDYDPAGGFPTGIGRLFLTPSSGDATLTGLLAGGDGQLLWILNQDTANNLILNMQDSGSSAANRFLGEGSSLILGPGARTLAMYSAGSINRWNVG